MKRFRFSFLTSNLWRTAKFIQMSILLFPLCKLQLETEHWTENIPRQNEQENKASRAVQWHALAITFDRKLIVPLQMRSIVWRHNRRCQIQMHTHTAAATQPLNRSITHTVFILFILVLPLPAWEMEIDFFFQSFRQDKTQQYTRTHTATANHS